MTTTKKPDLLRATSAFTCDLDGEPFLVHQGDVVRADHPIVEGREELFEPADAPQHE